jgi:EmrB/QacA subfamily drug resistance transporter
MLSTGLVALDSTIIATAVPSVVHDLGGFAQFSWLFAVYLLTQAVTVPLYGTFSDRVGRRPIMLLGIGIFLLGSILCGVAWNMPALIAFRALQGVGAGAVQPMSMTIVGDLYSVRERARVQGYVASVWGISSVLGPVLGGLFSQYLTWRWIFFVNVPVGALAAWMLVRHFREEVVPRFPRVDFAGAFLLAGGVSLLIVLLIEGGVAWPWPSVTTGVLGASSGVLLALFAVAETRAAEPVLPPWILTRRTLAGGSLAAFGVGALLIGLSSYVPTYVQGVFGTGALIAGFAFASVNIGWPLAATVSGRIYLRIGFRDTALIGTGLLLAGAILYNLLSRQAHVWEVAAAGLVIGAGMGMTASPTMVAVQSVVSWDRRGVVTGAYMFCRSVGSAIGAAVFGAIANGTLTGILLHSSGPRTLDAVTAVLGGGGANDSAATEHLREALYEASHAVFLALIVVCLMVLGSVLLIPRRTTQLTFESDRPHGRRKHED